MGDAMEQAPPILEFRDVTIPAWSHTRAPIQGVSFALWPGELLMLRLEHGNEHVPIADAAEGLVALEQGAVLFKGRDWATVALGRQLRLRALIGRVFEEHGWVSNLDVLENVVLAERHHTRRPTKEIVAEALALAARFGLSTLPEVRPAWLHRRDLRRAEWVRAFVGSPELIVLHEPTLEVPMELAGGLLDVVAEARGRGAAVLWITSSTQVWNELRLPDARRYAMRGAAMVGQAEGGRV